jgi:hypothetical protein
VVTHVHQQDRWILGVQRAMQVAIAQQLKTVYELPTELTPKLIALMAAMEKPKEERN